MPQGHGKVVFMQPEAALACAGIAGVVAVGGGDVVVAVVVSRLADAVGEVAAVVLAQPGPFVVDELLPGSAAFGVLVL